MKKVDRIAGGDCYHRHFSQHAFARAGESQTQEQPPQVCGQHEDDRMKTIGQGFTSVAIDYEDCFPWMLTAEDGRHAYKDSVDGARYSDESKWTNLNPSWGLSRYIQYLWYLPPLMDSLDSVKTQYSPMRPRD